MRTLLIMILFASAAIAADAEILLKRKARAHDSIEAIGIFNEAVLEKHLLVGKSRRGQVPEVRAAKEQEQVPVFQARFYTIDGCGPCQLIKQRFGWLRESGWKISNSPNSHIQIMDETNGASGAVVAYPTVVMLKNGVEIGRYSVGSAEQLIDLYNSTVQRNSSNNK